MDAGKDWSIGQTTEHPFYKQWCTDTTKYLGNQFTAKQMACSFQHKQICFVINRPGVARAVLQTPLSLID